MSKTAEIIDGKAVAAELRARVAKVAAKLSKDGINPGLAVVLVGEDPASSVYVKSKGKQTTAAGMNSFTHTLSADTGEYELLAVIEKLNNDPAVNGILIQLPLPPQISAQKVINAINPEKDVDGFHAANVGDLTIGNEGLVPCTPAGCLLLLQKYCGNLSGKNAVIIGRSNIVGKPLAMLLLRENCTVTIAHSRTKDLPKVCAAADILVAAVGVAELVKRDWVKPGAVVIDVGINRVAVGDKTKLVGDVDFAEAAEVAAAITPVPGGVGPMTIACLLCNTIIATCRQNKIAIPDDM